MHVLYLSCTYNIELYYAIYEYVDVLEMHVCPLHYPGRYIFKMLNVKSWYSPYTSEDLSNVAFLRFANVSDY